MKKIFSFTILISLTIISLSSYASRLDMEELIDLRGDSKVVTENDLIILKKVASYQVYEYESHPFKDSTYKDIKNKLGLLGLSPHFTGVLPNKSGTIPLAVDLPKNFQVKDKWPNCQHEVRDQQKCGSCWAFAATSVLSDRICIYTQSAVNVVLSPQDLVSCDKTDMGCQGGYLDRSWNYLINTGVVVEDCYPYSSGTGESGECQLKGQCLNKEVTYKKYKAKAFKTFKSVEEIKNDIYTNGSVETGFLVYQDFISYKSGIYKKTSDVFLGGHAVRVVGWGVDAQDNTEYWVVANSWGPQWGEEGHFRIAISNCCNFEVNMISGTPKLSLEDFLF
jgi:cathepsin B